MNETLQLLLHELAVNWIGFLILLVGGWLMRKLPENMRINIEAKHREALHKALNTAADRILAMPGVKDLIDDIDLKPYIDRFVDYVYASVPDALEYFAPPPERVKEMLLSKVQAKLLELAKAAPQPPQIVAIDTGGIAPV